MKSTLEQVKQMPSIAELVAYFAAKGFHTIEDMPYADRIMRKRDEHILEVTIHRRALLDCIAYVYLIEE